MKQFEYEVISRATGRVEHVRATAISSDIARAQIVLVYGSQFDVAGLYSGINPPHRIVGEIDCSDFPLSLSDYDWLMRESRKIEDTYATSEDCVAGPFDADERANRALSCDHYAGF